MSLNEIGGGGGGKWPNFLKQGKKYFVASDLHVETKLIKLTIDNITVHRNADDMSKLLNNQDARARTQGIVDKPAVALLFFLELFLQRDLST